MIFPDTDIETAAQLMEEYRKTIADTEFVYGDQTLRISVSVGLSTCPADAQSRVTLFEFADKALYSSKSGGRNRVTTYSGGDPVQITPEEE